MLHCNVTLFETAGLASFACSGPQRHVFESIAKLERLDSTHENNGRCHVCQTIDHVDGHSTIGDHKYGGAISPLHPSHHQRRSVAESQNEIVDPRDIGAQPWPHLALHRNGKKKKKCHLFATNVSKSFDETIVDGIEWVERMLPEHGVVVVVRRPYLCWDEGVVCGGGAGTRF